MNRDEWAPILVATMLIATAAPCAAYSVLAHEAAVDIAWDKGIKPFLEREFPHTSKEAMDRARSFAYGGSVIQDLGYYPFGNKFFSNLLHYTRSGDFVTTLLLEARDVDELAFALGALGHYSNDTTGHPDAVNLSVPMLFPKLQAKFGNVITYEQAPKQHVLVEFSFDVAQTARMVYPLSAYRQLIGFRVAVPLLERAFYTTYALHMSDIFTNQDRAIATYRYAVSQMIPALTEAAWRSNEKEIVALAPTLSRDGFVLAYRRADFEREFGPDYQKPALFARFLAWVYRIVPKIGPLKPLAFKPPTPEAARLFARSEATAHSRFVERLNSLNSSDRRTILRNVNYDTGQPTRRGQYALADATYAELVDRLAERQFRDVSRALRQNIITFYKDAPKPSVTSGKSRRREEQLQRALATLAAADRVSGDKLAGTWPSSNTRDYTLPTTPANLCAISVAQRQRPFHTLGFGPGTAESWYSLAISTATTSTPLPIH